MGSTFTPRQTLPEAIAECLEPHSRARVLAHYYEAGELWSVREFTDEDGKVKRIIVVDLLTSERGGVWCKSMDETMGPMYYRVPVAFLDIAQDFAGTAYSKDWRARVLRANGIDPEARSLFSGGAS